MHVIVWLVPKLAAALFAITGFVFFADPAPLSRLLADSGYGHNFARVFGACALATALFLSIPQLRLWGITVAALVLFGTTITLLEHRKYLYALPGILLLGALPLSLASS